MLELYTLPKWAQRLIENLQKSTRYNTYKTEQELKNKLGEGIYNLLTSSKEITRKDLFLAHALSGYLSKHAQEDYTMPEAHKVAKAVNKLADALLYK